MLSTDLGFSYSARGEVTDVYQKTPNSGGYYHVTAGYWANGALNTLSGLGLPILTYNVDGEGRPSTLGASSGQNPVTSLTYNVASQVTNVTFGSSDKDDFAYDPNTGRMTQYKFTVGATPKTVTGDLTWNANGTLQKLVVTDQFNAANSQTCKYGDPANSVAGYDDLGRLLRADCGTIWGQTFSFDPFGNIDKAVITGDGGVAFQPTYSSTSNRYSTLPGFTPTYDANGNLTADSFHTYAWDADGNVTTIDPGGNAVGLTYDALDRMVEQASGSSHTQIVYAPTGQKLALMNGLSTVLKAFVPLPGGPTAVYAGSTLSFYRHPDWLGSSRFASTPARAVYAYEAYAPYGEPYAESTTKDRSFTGQNNDTANDLYDFLFREYHPTQGRWVRPDPAGLGAVNISNPQSLNRYAYVMSPLSMVDPLGLAGHCKTEGCERLHENDDLAFRQAGQTCGTIEGMPATCAMMRNVLLSGAGVNCPNNDCTGVRVEQGPGDSVVVKQYEWIDGYVVSYGDMENGYVVRKEIGHWGWQTTGILSGSLPAGGDVPVGMDIWHCQGCAATWRNASGAANTALFATAVVLIAVPAVGEAGGAIAACAPGINTSNYGHVTVYCRGWMAGNLIGIGYDPSNGVHINVGGSIHIPLWPPRH